MKNDNKGFSLIELIVVIAIMAILVGALAPQFLKYVESSRQSADIQNAAAIKSAVEAGVAAGDIKSDITLTISGTGDQKIDITGTEATALSSNGIGTSVNLKSKGWHAQQLAVYSATNYTWSVTDNENTKEPKNKISDAFK